MMYNPKQRYLRTIAAHVRETLKSVVRPYLLDQCYMYGEQDHLGGYCGYGATMLFTALKNLGLNAQVIIGSGHYFVKCDEFLVDITASQFGQGMVCVRRWDLVQEKANNKNYDLSYWRATRYCNSPKEAGLGTNESHIEAAFGKRNV